MIKLNSRDRMYIRTNKLLWLVCVVLTFITCHMIRELQYAQIILSFPLVK